ncbi:hypothetical protein [Rhodopirellula sp. P2]|uniref:hypothetical protein n=1 Tax=Rhodopirellula sp. P2 TaxID=2127060 RepID=UPI0023680B7E|nr:hypothetical protein [Rhodopirellula sp. P2]WDQ18636.1 hypothetical protein PSR62_08855 [Rhodopirellula sp. P2]
MFSIDLRAAKPREMDDSETHLGITIPAEYVVSPFAMCDHVHGDSVEQVSGRQFALELGGEQCGAFISGDEPAIGQRIVKRFEVREH